MKKESFETVSCETCKSGDPCGFVNIQFVAKNRKRDPLVSSGCLSYVNFRGIRLVKQTEQKFRRI